MLKDYYLKFRKGTEAPDLLILFYNFSIIIFILISIKAIHNGSKLLFIHIGAAVCYCFLIWVRTHTKSALFFYPLYFLPLLFLLFFHYEVGLLNRVIFPELMDQYIQKLDILIFGTLPNRLLSTILPYNFVHQLFHLFYSFYYLILFVPVTLLYYFEIKATQKILAHTQPVRRLNNTPRMFFGSLFSMLCCYWIFIIFPVAGPVAEHAELFPQANGLIAVMNFLFKVGDLEGGAIPSSHIAGSLVVVIYSFRYLRRYSIFILTTFILLFMSTVYCSYHYLVDVLAGLLAGFVFYFLGDRLFDMLNRSILAKNKVSK